MTNEMTEGAEASTSGAQLLDGRALAKATRLALKADIATLATQGIVPGLDLILVGDDTESEGYVHRKQRACERLGIRSRIHQLGTDADQEALEVLIQTLNDDDDVDGILIQLPLPPSFDTERALAAVAPVKDVDGLHPVNLGRLVDALPAPRPCTPAGCLALIDSIGYDLAGKKAVVVGRSSLVGKPVALMLLERHATVTICHTYTRNLEDVLKDADVVVAAAGQPGLIRGEWLKPGVVVIDVGINRLDDGSLVGDVAFDEAHAKAFAITPVPGGVGPMTVTMLLSNTYQQALARRGFTAPGVSLPR